MDNGNNFDDGIWMCGRPVISFRAFYENSSDPVRIQILCIRCDSAGGYGETPDEEYPAGDPLLGGVKWEWDIEPANEAAIQGKAVEIIQNPIAGSYHEKWTEIFAYALVTAQEAESSWTWDGKPGRRGMRDRPQEGFKVVTTTTYGGKGQLVRDVMAACKVKGPNGELPEIKPLNPPASSADYWVDQVRRKTAGKPPDGWAD